MYNQFIFIHTIHDIVYHIMHTGKELADSHAPP